MNINFSKTIYEALSKGRYILPRRGLIYVGFKCHQKCGFCYYHDKCAEDMFSFDDIKRQIDFEYDYGIKDFEITGGEPSEYIELRRVCEYIKQKDNNSKIAVITNGGLWKDDIWDLVDEVLLSYHIGKNDLLYDKDIFPLGNTFSKACKTVDKARSLNKLIRTNTVVGTFNIAGMLHILDDLVYFKPDILNFLPVNLFDQAKTMNKYIDYSLLRQTLKNAIDILKQKLQHTLIFVRYIPFCQMEGYEQHIVGHMQHIYDWFDWNRELDGTGVLEYVNDYDKKLASLGRYGSTSLQNVIDTRDLLYTKSSKCITCKYNLICDGVEKTSNNELEKYICPSAGQIIKDPMHYIKDTTYNFYNKIYGKL